MSNRKLVESMKNLLDLMNKHHADIFEVRIEDEIDEAVGDSWNSDEILRSLKYAIEDYLTDDATAEAKALSFLKDRISQSYPDEVSWNDIIDLTKEPQTYDATYMHSNEVQDLAQDALKASGVFESGKSVRIPKKVGPKAGSGTYTRADVYPWMKEWIEKIQGNDVLKVRSEKFARVVKDGSGEDVLYKMPLDVFNSFVKDQILTVSGPDFKRHRHSWYTLNPYAEDYKAIMGEQINEESESDVEAFFQQQGIKLADPEFIPDPQIEGVWLVFDHTNKQAFLVYLHENDFEDVEYEDAVKKYSKRANESAELEEGWTTVTKGITTDGAEYFIQKLAQNRKWKYWAIFPKEKIRVEIPQTQIWDVSDKTFDEVKQMGQVSRKTGHMLSVGNSDFENYRDESIEEDEVPGGRKKKAKGYYSGAWNKAEKHTKYDPPKTGNKGKSARRGFVG